MDPLEQLYLAPANATPYACWEHDLVTDKIRWHSAFQEFYGYPASELGEHPSEWSKRIHPDDLARVTHGFDLALKSDASHWTDQYRFIRRDGVYVHVEDHCVFLRDARGTAIRAVGTMRDITVLRQAHLDLLEREATLRLVLESMRDVFWMTNADLTQTYYISPSYETVWGRPLEEMYRDPKRFIKAIHPEDKGPFVNLFQAGSAAQAFDIEFRIIRPDGSIRWIRNRGFPVQDGDGQIRRFAGVSADITEQKQAEERIQESETRFRLMANSAPVLIWVSEKDRSCSWFNQVWLDFTGRTLKQERGYGWLEGVHPDDRERCVEWYQRHFERRQPFSMDYRLQRHDGEYRWIIDRGVPRFDQTGCFAGYIGSCVDITERKRIEEELLEQQAHYERVASTVPLMLYDYIIYPDETDQFLYVGPKAHDILGIEPAELMANSKTFWQILHPEDLDRLQKENKTAFHARHEFFSSEVRIITPAGNLKWIQIASRPGPAKDNGVPIWSGFMLDVTDQKLAQQRIEFLAFHDGLTQLPNRILGQDRLGREIASAQRHGTHLAVLYFDMDKFKYVNDTHGHGVGDLLLQAVAGRLKENLREADSVCRLSGDEFMMVLPELDPQLLLSQISSLCERLLEGLAVPFELEGTQVFSSFSIGVAIYPQDGTDSGTLMRHADTALYEAKKHGPHTYRFFTPEMNAALVRFIETRDALRFSVEHNEFELFYQPQINLTTGRITGLEALIRWQRPGFGLTLPGDFIEVSEESGLIVSIGRWMLQEACRKAVTLHKRGWTELTMAVNLSGVQFLQPGLSDDFLMALNESGLNPARLEVELTESVLLQNVNSVQNTINVLKDAGIQLALDDFGTGFSSLTYLKRFKVDKLKFDRSFIADLLTDEQDQAIVHAIIQMARSLKIKTIAEGVETSQLAEHLRDMGCDEAQGHWFAKPIPSGEVERWLREHDSRAC